MNRILGIIFLVFFGGGLNLTAQTDLTIALGGTPPSTADNCVRIFQGQTVSLRPTVTCALDIEIQYDKGPMITGTGSIIDTIKAASPMPYPLTFDSVGVYSLYCNMMSAKNIADQCYNVLSEPVPTVSEWGLIILALLMLIVSIVLIQQRKVTSALVER